MFYYVVVREHAGSRQYFEGQAFVSSPIFALMFRDRDNAQTVAREHGGVVFLWEIKETEIIK